MAMPVRLPCVAVGQPLADQTLMWSWSNTFQGKYVSFPQVAQQLSVPVPPLGNRACCPLFAEGATGEQKGSHHPCPRGICPTRKMTWIVELNSSGGHWRGRGPCLVLKLSGQALAGTGAFVMLSPSQHAAPSWQSTAFRRCYCCCFGCLVRNEKCSSAGRRLGGGTGCASTAAAFSRRAFHLLAAALDEAALGFLDPENELREDFPSQVLAAFVSQSKM